PAPAPAPVPAPKTGPAPERARGRKSGEGAGAPPAAIGTEPSVYQRIPPQPRLPTDFPLLKQHHSGCLHCHQVQEYRLLQSFADGAFNTDLLFPFPLPENVGLEFDRDHGYRVTKVREKSPAARAGIEVGDVLLRSGGNPVRSEDDFRWTLHHAPPTGDWPLEVLRGSAEGTATENTPQRVAVTLSLEAGWKRGDVSWRKSLRSYPVVWGFLGYSLGAEERREQALPLETLALKVVSIRGQSGGVAQALGLQKGDLIIAVEDDTQVKTLEQFKSNLLGRYKPGSPMEWRVIRGGREVTVKGSFPAWQTTDRTVP
ncbi:MAG: PDZ domain-containing protein, partial [Planctomycetaceae bacterium]